MPSRYNIIATCFRYDKGTDVSETLDTIEAKSGKHALQLFREKTEAEYGPGVFNPGRFVANLTAVKA